LLSGPFVNELGEKISRKSRLYLLENLQDLSEIALKMHSAQHRIKCMQVVGQNIGLEERLAEIDKAIRIIVNPF
jgi:3-dehydroquinate dehydratase